MSIEIEARAYQAIKEIIEWAEKDSEIRDRESESRCICKWSVQFTVTGNHDDARDESARRFDEHVASGECPEERDEEGNII